MENRMKVPQKIKYRPPYDPTIWDLGIHPKKMETLISKDTHTQFHSSIIYDSQDTEATKSVHQQING